mmetsp:Transcript_40407/g.79070  ORF Transcript_40407/g.79070 Transcript_40407/m.79070 type:complete len:217 (+) Transcript_40407:205-855(+)
MVAASLAASFAMAASLVKGLFASFSMDALQFRSRAESVARAIRESLICIDCRSAMGDPNAFRSSAYAAAQSMDACAMPNACPATPIRPPSSVTIAILNPSPSSPRSWSAETFTSSMMRFAVDDARMPILSSFAPRENPGASVDTTNAEMPLCFFDLSVVANTTAAAASCAFVIQALVPLRIYPPSPSGFAVVLAAPASLPFPGSLSPKHPIFSPDA